MNQVRQPPSNPVPTEPGGGIVEDLAVLARLVRVDMATGDLIIENGASRLVLKRDGTVRVEGARIVGIADETIALHAGVIKLN